MTKREIRQEFWNLVESEGIEIQHRAFKLFEQDKVTYGWYLLHNLFDNYHYEELANIKNIDYITKWSMNYDLEKFKEHLKESLKEIEEQEKLPFEESQKQILSKAQ